MAVLYCMVSIFDSGLELKHNCHVLGVKFFWSPGDEPIVVRKTDE